MAAKKKTPSSTKARKRRLRTTPDWAPSFLKALESLGRVTHACDAVQIARRTAYDRRRVDPDFEQAWDRIIEERHAFDDESFDEMKRELAKVLIDQATNGLPRLKVSKGVVVHHKGEPIEERHFSSGLQVFLAQSLLGWKPVSRQEITGADGDPIKVEDARQRLGDLASRHAGDGGSDEPRS